MDTFGSQGPGLVEGLAGRERRALEPQQLGGLGLAAGPGTLQAQHALVVTVEAGGDLQGVASGGQHPGQHRQRGLGIATVDGVGQIPGRHIAGVAQVGLDVGHAQVSPGTEGPLEGVEQDGQAAHLLAQVVDQPRPGRGVEDQVRGRQVLVEPGGSLAPGAGLGVDHQPARPGHGVDQLAGHGGHACPRPGPLLPGQDQHRGTQRVGQIGHQRRHGVGGGEHRGVATHHHPTIGQERRGLRRIDQRPDAVGATVVLVAGGVELGQHEGAVGTVERGVDQLAHRVGHQDRIVTLHQVDGNAVDLGHAASRMAASTSATRRPAMTSWQRSTRQPSPTPSVWAATVPSAAPSTSTSNSFHRNRLLDADRNTG